MTTFFVPKAERAADSVLQFEQWTKSLDAPAPEPTPAPSTFAQERSAAFSLPDMTAAPASSPSLGTEQQGPPPPPAAPAAVSSPALNAPLSLDRSMLPEGAAKPQLPGLDVASILQNYEGLPYTYGGPGGRQDPREGVLTDCSGFVAAVWKQRYGLDLPAHTDTSYNQLRKLGAAQVSQQDAQAGDVVYYMGAGTGGAITHHMGIYAGDGKVLDMSASGGGGAKLRAVGHAGEFVILRDPRVNGAAPRTADTAPRAVEPSGIAESVGGPQPSSFDAWVKGLGGSASSAAGAVERTGTAIGTAAKSGAQQFEEWTRSLGDAAGEGANAVGGAVRGGLDAAGEARDRFYEPVENQDAYNARTRGDTSTLADRITHAVTREPYETDAQFIARQSPDAIASAKSMLNLNAGMRGQAATEPTESELARSLANLESNQNVAMSVGATSGSGAKTAAGFAGKAADDAGKAVDDALTAGMPKPGEVLPPPSAATEARMPNLDYMAKDMPDVRANIQRAAEADPAMFDKYRQGTITHRQLVEDLAPKLGMTADDFLKTPVGKAFKPEELLALRATVVKTQDDLVAEAQRLIDKGGINAMSATEKAAMLEQIVDAGRLTALGRGAASTAGRSLNQQKVTITREMANAITGGNNAEVAVRVAQRQQEQAARLLEKMGGKEATDDLLKGFLDVQQSGDPLAAAQFLRGLQHVSMWDRISILRYAAMLSSTTTHLVNATGNTIGLGLDIALKPLAVGVDTARVAAFGGQRTRYMAEIAPQIRGAGEGAVAGLREGLVTLRTGINPSDAARLDHVRAGFQSGNAAVDALAEAPLRALSFADSVFRGAARGGQHRALATRQAVREGLSGAERAARADEIMQNLAEYPDLLAEAEKAAARVVLQETRTASSAILNLKSQDGVLGATGRVAVEGFLPFVKTPYNVAAQGLGMTPAGVVGMIDSAVRAGKATGTAKLAHQGEFADRTARAVFGTAVMAGAGGLAMNGMVTGAFPTDEKERSTLPPGWQPWSLKIPNGSGGTTYVEMSKLGPVAIPFAIGTLLGMAKAKGEGVDPSAVASSVGRFMMDQSFLRGISDVLKAVEDPKRYSENITENLVTSFVPYAALSRQVTRALGMADRDPKGALEALMALTPLTADNVPRRQDSLGKPVESQQTGIGAFVVPLKYNAGEDNPTLKAFRDAGIGIGDAPKEVKGAALTEAEQRAFQTEMGKALEPLVAKLQASSSWSRLTKAQQATALDRMEASAREVATAKALKGMGTTELKRRLLESKAK